MITAFIVDDESKSRSTLRKILGQKCPAVQVLGESEGIVQAERKIRALNPELVFLDIRMPGGSGFDLLDKFSPVEFDVIFTTAFDQYAIKAIKCSALDYLLKPLHMDQVKTAVDRALKKKRKNQKIEMGQIEILKSNRPDVKLHKLAIAVHDGLHFISIADIIYCTADGAYTRFVIDNNTSLIASKRIKEYEQLLTENSFCRVHHSSLINLNHIKRYVKGEGGYVIMSNGDTVNVSRRRKPEFLQHLKY